MSKTFTSRAAVTQGRGRGRGTQTQSTNATRNTTMQGARPRVGAPAPTNPGLRSQPTSEEGDGEDIGQRMSYEGGYTKITPNMKKRQQINDMAARESESYQAYKQQHTQKSFSYVGTAGGGQMTEAEARQKTIQTTPNKAQKLLQNQARKSFMKQKEEEELQKKKELQRQKSLQNEQRKKESEQATANKWEEQRRRTNEAFLNRIEAKNKKLVSGSTQNASTSIPVAQRVPTESQKQLQQPKGAAASREVTREYRGSYNYSDDCESDKVNDMSSDQRKALVALSAVFPDYPQETLIELLQQVDYSVDSAIILLTE